jgi:hypothetical protein
VPIIRRNSPHGAQIDSQPDGDDGVHVQISHPSWGSATVKTSEKSGSKEPTLVTLETGLSVSNTPKKKVVNFPDKLAMAQPHRSLLLKHWSRRVLENL